MPKDQNRLTCSSRTARTWLERRRAAAVDGTAYDRLEARVAEIQALEKRGDEIDREVKRKLEDAFVTPFDREDIHELASRLDDVVDGIQEIAETFVIYGIDSASDEGRQLTRSSLDGQAIQLLEALKKLEGLDLASAPTSRTVTTSKTRPTDSRAPRLGDSSGTAVTHSK